MEQVSPSVHVLAPAQLFPAHAACDRGYCAQRSARRSRARGWNGAARIPLSLREFLRLESPGSCAVTIPGCHGPVARLPHERPHGDLLTWVLALIAEAGLVKGERHRASISLDHGVPYAALVGHTFVRRDFGRGLPGPPPRDSRLAAGERHRDTHGRGPGAPGPQAQGQEARRPPPRLVSRRATACSRPSIAKMKDVHDLHLGDTRPRARGGSSRHRSRWWPPSYLPLRLRSRRDTTTAVGVSMPLACGQARISRRWTRQPTAEDPPHECVTDKRRVWHSTVES